MPPSQDGLEAAIEEIGGRKKWIWIIFCVISMPGVFNIWHLTAYVFLGQALPHWCAVPELQATNWTSEQIRTISSPGGISGDSCEIVNWNYTILAALSYEEALNYISNVNYPGQYECDSWSYEGNGIVSEWDLVCSRTPLKSTVQMTVSLGKFLGALVFGFVADKWGRKRSFAISCILYIIAGPVAAFAPHYLVFCFARLALGMAGSGTFNCGFTLLTEFITKKHRTLLGILYNMPYPLGMMLLPLIALYIENWRMLQLALSVPTVILIFHIWFLPESPRWLISQDRREEAWKIVKRFSKKSEMMRLLTLGAQSNPVEKSDAPEKSPVPAAANTNTTNSTTDKSTEHVLWYKRTITALKKLFAIFANSELRKRLLICYFAWCVTAMTYYSLALNADNFTADRYLYVAVAGGVEAVSYILPIPMMRWTGRRTTSVLLYIISGAALLSILAIPEDMTDTIMSVAMIGRLCIGAVYSVIILQTSELFPTVNRNTAVGTSSTMSHLGSLSAPYIVDLLGAQAWYIPSTICGAAVLIAGLLVLMLPETKDKEICDTVEEIMERSSRDKVSLRNCWPF
ncbi:organic cation transporter protein isoform X3 [Cryptotermes secundus]|nr:organic cation transporter protein isoform X3 [Cryptotermes secundus]XP_023709705.1 organic cation transporter protein isoform X3 [Cryptotermes secundus]XP_033607828.1 organic cation transporter protein isoform X3 [Cryptotermes secundus]